MNEHYHRTCVDEADLQTWQAHYSELGYASYRKGLVLHYFVADCNYRA